MGLRERLHPLQTSRYQPSRLGAVPLGQGEQHTSHGLARLGKVGLPLRVGRVLRGQALGDGEAGAVFGQRPGQVALGVQDVADSLVGDGKVALPAGMGRVLRGQALANSEAVAVFG